MQDKMRKIKTIMAFGELHNRPLSEAAMGLYLLALAPYTADHVEKAAGKLLARCKFFPQPAEFIEELTGGNDAKKIEAENALEDALKQVRLVGCYRAPSLDPITAAVISNRFGGWVKFCMADMNSFARKDFVEEYQIQQAHGVKDAPQMIGLHDERANPNRGVMQIGEIVDHD